jgi:hypothetical protein
MKIYVRWIALGVMIGFPLGGQRAAADDADNAAKGSDCATSATDCECCPSACCGCCPPEWKIVAGAEEQFLWSHVTGRNGVITVDGASVLQPGSGELGGYQPAGLGWLGVENSNGTGFRARYWDYDQSSSGFSNPPFEVVSAASSLRAYTVDLEATQRVNWDGWNCLGSAGARYASLKESALFSDSFSNFSVNPVTNDTLAGDTESEFHGTGLTLGLEATRPLNDCGVNFVATGRGSVLWGDSSSSSMGRFAHGGSSVTNSTTNDANETHYIVEFQSGLEWSTYVQYIHGVVFFRGVFEYQLWSGQDAPTSSTPGGGPPSLLVNSPTQKVDFLGPALSTGVCW